MPQLIRPSTKVRIVPKEGEIEITLNINITVDGIVSASSENAKVAVQEPEDTKPPTFIPEFGSNTRINFGKKE